MASSSSSSSNPSSSFLPAPDAVQVLVSSLADESPLVRDASMAALKEIAPLNPLLVLNCCLSVSRGGRRRFGNMAGAFVVMASAVHSMDQRDVDPALMGKLAKIATAEMITSKELYADWQRAAASLLVSIGSHDPDLLMEEIFLHMSGPNSSVPAMVQILADFASAEAMQFTPRLKDVLSRVLPILGNVKDVQRPIFANAFKCWFQAAWQYVGDDDAPAHILDSDIMSFLSSVFELLWKVWASSRDLKVRSSSVEALGQMVGLVTRTELKSALPRLVSTILELYKRDQDVIFLATCSLHGLLNATLLSESGPPLLDFEIYNEVQHCFLEVGSVYPDDLFVFLLNKCQAKDEALTLGALCVVKHLLPRLIESWHSKRPLLIEAAKLLLHEENLGIRKALAEVKMGDVCPEELRAICEKGLILLAVTIPEMEALWHLAPIFPKNISLFWEDEKGKLNPASILNLASGSTLSKKRNNGQYERIEIQNPSNQQYALDSGWIMSLGDAFSRHYELYAPDDEHSGFLHRCLGMLLQKVDDRAYVRDKINWMYKNANISVPTNRLGLAKGMGLVASSHLDTVLEKLKEILNNVGQNKFQRFLSFFSGGIKVDDTDDIHAGLALMYGYAARYAPSTVIEARIDALVGTNMLSRLLHVHHPVAKQAVITAIDLLGQGVINASESGVSFPLKRRDQLLDYTLTLMGVDENDGLVDSGHELLRTQTLALSACTTLVSVEPKLTVETRNRVLKATLGFFALSNDPSDIVEPLIDNLITLLCTILLTRSMGLTPDIDIEISYNALGSLEDVISILRSDASIDQSEIFNRVVSSVCSLLTKDELVITLHGCTSAICDKVRLSAEGTIQAVVEFITKRGNELNETDVTRQTLQVTWQRHLGRSARISGSVLQEVLSHGFGMPVKLKGMAEEREVYHNEDVEHGFFLFLLLKGSYREFMWIGEGGMMVDSFPMFPAFSQHGSLSFLFLEHVISVLNQNPLTKGDAERGDVSGHSIEFVVEKDILQAALLALNSLFRGGGKTGKKAVEKNYATVLSALILQLGSCHGLARSGHLEPLWSTRARKPWVHWVVHKSCAAWICRYGSGGVAGNGLGSLGEIGVGFGGKVQPMCAILCKALNRHQRFQRDASASALSEFIRFSDGVPSLLEQMVEAMCLHVSDDSPTIPSRQMIHYATQVLSVIVALLEDPDESVQLTAVECALMVLESPPKEAVDPVLLNLSLRLRNLQISTNVKMRSSAFAAYGALCNYSIGAQQEAFFEQC
ncbi:hypothetical protein QJS04_geneDACA000260 [Acorus gramineus]|uniref:Uncharacterized protein n=1 Tax=Acorus gramineus TaxID=55184 RepID=A0AAV9ANS1_ACOGR|nr:hypothetical protein QJS04_geneDACA000260 [Acorus gramineus]